MDILAKKNYKKVILFLNGNWPWVNNDDDKYYEVLIHSNTNFSAMSIHFAKKKIKQSIIFNGYNSKNIFLANILWYFKSILPSSFGGFKKKITFK